MPLDELLLVLLGAVFVATPFVTIYLLAKFRSLRSDFRQFSEEAAKKESAFRRELAELKRQMAVAPAAARTSEKESGPPVAAKEDILPPKVAAPVDKPRPAIPVEPEKSRPPVRSDGVEKIFESWTATPPVAPVPSVKPTPPLDTPPATPPVAIKQDPSQPAAAKPPVEEGKPAPTEPPRPTAPPASVRIPAPTPMAAFKVPPAGPTFKERMKTVSSIEETLGTNWLQKIGIIILVIGVAMFGAYELSTVGPAGKVTISYMASVLLLVGGIVLEKRDRYRLIGRPCIGGGWALLFFSTFALYHVEAMHVLREGVANLTIDCALMLVVAVGMGVHTLRYRSQFVTGLAFLLGYTTVALSQDTVYSLSAGIFLAIGLVLIVKKMAWFELEIFGILSSYLNHLYWLYRILGIDGAHGHPFAAYHASIAILFLYWAIFRVSYIIRTVKTDFEEHVSTVAAILNVLLLLSVLKFQSVQPQLAYIALLTLGAFEFAIGQIPSIKRRREAFIVLTLVGTALMLAAAPAHYVYKDIVTIFWLIGAEVLLIAGVLVREIVFRRIGLFTGLLATAYLAAISFPHLIDARASGQQHVLDAGLLFSICAVVFYGNSLGVATRWKEFFTSTFESNLVLCHSFAGLFAAATGVWAFFSNDWLAIGWMALAVLLIFLSRWFSSRAATWQANGIAILAYFQLFSHNFDLNVQLWPHVSLRLLTVGIAILGSYAFAESISQKVEEFQLFLRNAHTWVAAFFVGFLIGQEIPQAWVAVSFLAAGIILALVGRRLNRNHFLLQENVFATAAVAQIFYCNYELTTHYGHLSLRLITVSLLAAGCYAISRRSSLRNSLYALVSSYLHTAAATTLLAGLMWYEAPTGWLAVLWAVFALSLIALDRVFKLDDLRWQGHALAVATLLRCVTVNIYVQETWHGLSIRLISLALVAAIFYALTRIARISQEWRDRDFHHLYSWAASTLISLLIWFELQPQPLSIAVAWAAFGLVLFQYGIFRKIAQFRWQAYVVLVAAFVRIFFANLTAGEPGGFLGPRMYTVVPIALIFFFVYAQLPVASEVVEKQRKSPISSATLLAYLGTISVAALLYFQVPQEWVVTAYAGLSFALLGISLLLRRPLFAHQALLATLGVLARGLAHNLYGGSYFSSNDWLGRFVVLGSAEAILIASLFFAFRLRDREAFGTEAKHARGNWLSFLIHRPEQLQFFVAITLLTLMLARKMPGGSLTIAWGIEGVLIFLFALIVKERSFRLSGLVLLLVCVAKVMALDAWALQTRDRYLTFIIVGAALVGVSMLYTRYRETIRQYL